MRGEVKLRSFTEHPDDLLRYSPLTDATGARVFHLRITGHGAKDQLIAAIEGIADRNAAESLKNTSLYTDADTLPPPDKGEYYYSSLEGMAVRNENESFVGTVKAIHNYGAGDILEIEYENGETEMFPFQDTLFPEVNEETRTVTFIAPEILE